MLFRSQYSKTQWLRDFPGGPVGGLHTPYAGGPGSIPGWGMRSCMHAATKSPHAATRSPHATTKDPACRNEDPACLN